MCVLAVVSVLLRRVTEERQGLLMLCAMAQLWDVPGALVACAQGVN